MTKTAESGNANAKTESNFLFTSESVTEGHPDKVCDQISDAILDAILEQEAQLARDGYIAPSGEPADLAAVRCACEVMATTGLVVVTGEIRTQAYIDVPTIVRGVINDIGYNRAKFGFDGATCGVINTIHEQSADIALGVDTSYEEQQGIATDDDLDHIGAGDQGMVFGYACNDTATLMPLPIYLAHRLAEELTQVRKNGVLDYLRPDGKTQVSVRYVDGVPTQVEKVLISAQHAEEVELETLRQDLIEQVINPVFAREKVALADNLEVFVNPTGRFVIGGPM
ncbi:MAG: methionine adenosyltransferase, partial [Coriobacteriaceae bacterium]|nr:methionine adenosyltransferase [Coriobacteriaceae bacterium]